MFQFPSNGKADPKQYDLIIDEDGKSFNSLQTGKRIQSESTASSWADAATAFNSLQTGKRIQRRKRKLWSPSKEVMFQFPSNGKADPKCISIDSWLPDGNVSIPFKRESGSKAFVPMEYI